jgi:single-strand DNA-binding protein
MKENPVMALKVPAKFEGNLAADPETRISSRSGKTFVAFKVMENERIRAADGTWSDGDPYAIDVQVHDERLASNVTNSLKRGDRVVVDGTYSTEPYVKNGGELGTNHSLFAKNVYASLQFNNVTIERKGPSVAASDASADAWADVEVATIDSATATLN